jgi:hypothetical protein
VFTHPHMEWGLYVMEAAKAGDELLPVVGKQLSVAEFKSMCLANHQFLKYAIHVKKNVYQVGDVLNGNVAGFINNFIGREHLGNVHWEYVSLPTPWNPKTWGYIMTIATRDIDVGEELFTYYPLNRQDVSFVAMISVTHVTKWV